MKLLRKLLFPFVPVYFIITWVRNLCFDYYILKSKTFTNPIICVGNLSVGGTGKTPMIEYLISMLQERYVVATLSRGYKRKTKGYILADKYANALTIGDEPFQYYKKFKNIKVAVDSNRCRGISNLLKTKTAPDVILLDDAYQHRKVAAGLNILLTPYNNLYVDDILLPTGDLREPRIGAKRAKIIVVTKCPPSISSIEKKKIIERLQPLSHQKVFFSQVLYSDKICNDIESKPISNLTKATFTLVTGIANPKPLVEHLISINLDFEHISFKDHHVFSTNDIQKIKQKSLILTTEKDFVRLQPHFRTSSNHLYYLPIETTIDRKKEFKNEIVHFIS